MPADRFPPFITPESPSYERAGQEFRHPQPESAADMTAAFSFLCEVEQNAAAAYKKGAERVRAPALVERLASEAHVHEKCRGSLEAEVIKLGGAAPRDEECRELLMHGALEIEDLPGENVDDAVVEVLQAMRQEIEDLYEKVRARPGLSEAQRSALRCSPRV